MLLLNFSRIKYHLHSHDRFEGLQVIFGGLTLCYLLIIKGGGEERCLTLEQTFNNNYTQLSIGGLATFQQ